MNGTVPGISGEVAIYGASKCNNWAWKDQGNGPGPVNIMTALNGTFMPLHFDLLT